ncbi:heat shock protein transcriptional repressor HspR [Nocardioides bruguierae]|uniref:MerR family transcriptional regulator n=1 Tax=Nocardioides bruguierae TaxID=2945102 RepID=A0A9X2D7B3_9ACTN|nr:MerR family transcriptional regulator [Nocardioides bruguierae]MCL8023961.1 MerR family transcriptional regulator [Nocardioides bruguierae]MCM0620374.1 MerR family transcriptional regulator [Nocardioides bruguierae]
MAGRQGAGGGSPFGDPDAAVFVISVAAELTGLHPQTLRTYERMGLITPGRTGGGGRRYSQRDVERLRQIAELTASGTGIEGVRRILELENQVDALAARNGELVDENEHLREALRQAALRLRAAQAGEPASGAPSSGGRLPVLRRPDPGQSMVVWRRGR